MRHLDEPEPPEMAETVDGPEFKPLYSFSITSSMHHLRINDDTTRAASPSPSGDCSDDDFQEIDQNWVCSDDEFEDNDTTEPESSPGDWDDWDQESSFTGQYRFSISLDEGTVTVDVNGGESFNHDEFFQFQEMVSVMEGLVPPDSENPNDSWVEETILDNLKTRKYQKAADGDNQEPEICAICLVEFENETPMAALQCGHEYHADCVTKWLMRKNACPLCNRDGFKLQ